MSLYSPDADLRVQIRNATTTEYDELTRFKLRQASEALDKAVRDFQFVPNGTHLAALNGAWTNAIRTLNNSGLTKPKELA